MKTEHWHLTGFFPDQVKPKSDCSGELLKTLLGKVKELKLFGVKYVALITAVRFFLEVFHGDNFYIFKHRLNLRICGLEDLSLCMQIMDLSSCSSTRCAVHFNSCHGVYYDYYMRIAS